MLKEFVATGPVAERKGMQRPYRFPGWSDGVVMQSETWMDGVAGRPKCTFAGFPEHTGSWAHMHTSAQFQLILSGEMDFPGHHVTAPAVHYTEHCVPYGPFTVSKDHGMFVMSRYRIRQVYMPSAEAKAQGMGGDPALVKRLANGAGQYAVVSAKDVAWEAVAETQGLRRKVLVAGKAEIIECEGKATLPAIAAKHGRFEVLLSGQATADTATLRDRGVRYYEGSESPAAFVAGPRGATFAVLTFDVDSEWAPDEADLPPAH